MKQLHSNVWWFWNLFRTPVDRSDDWASPVFSGVSATSILSFQRRGATSSVDTYPFNYYPSYMGNFGMVARGIFGRSDWRTTSQESLRTRTAIPLRTM
jgi:hypothetical protein